MFYIAKIDDYLEILTNEEVKNFVAKNVNETIRKVAKSLYIFLTTSDKMESNSSDNCVHHYSIEILNIFDPELQLINTKPVIKNKLKELAKWVRKV